MLRCVVDREVLPYHEKYGRKVTWGCLLSKVIFCVLSIILLVPETSWNHSFPRGNVEEAPSWSKGAGAYMRSLCKCVHDELWVLPRFMRVLLRSLRSPLMIRFPLSVIPKTRLKSLNIYVIFSTNRPSFGASVTPLTSRSSCLLYIYKRKVFGEPGKWSLHIDQVWNVIHPWSTENFVTPQILHIWSTTRQDVAWSIAFWLTRVDAIRGFDPGCIGRN